RRGGRHLPEQLLELGRQDEEDGRPGPRHRLRLERLRERGDEVDQERGVVVLAEGTAEGVRRRGRRRGHAAGTPIPRVIASSTAATAGALRRGPWRRRSGTVDRRRIESQQLEGRRPGAELLEVPGLAGGPRP